MEPIARYEDTGFLHRCEYLLYSDRVVVNYSRRLSSQWQSGVPLTTLQSVPSRGWARGEELVPAVFSAASALGLAFYFQQKPSMSRELWGPVAFGLVGLIALLWAAANVRKQEWVAFEPVAGGRGLSIRRARRNSEQFERFVDAVTAQIKAAV